MKIITQEEWQKTLDAAQYFSYGKHNAQKPPTLLFSGVVNKERVTFYESRGAAIREAMEDNDCVFVEIDGASVRCLANDAFTTNDLIQCCHNMEMLEVIADMSKAHKKVALFCTRSTLDMLKRSGLPEVSVCKESGSLPNDFDAQKIIQKRVTERQTFFVTVSHDLRMRSAPIEKGDEMRLAFKRKDESNLCGIFLTCDAVAEPIEQIAVFSLHGNSCDMLKEDELSLLRGWVGVVEDVQLAQDKEGRDVLQIATTLSKAVSAIIMKLKAS